MVSTCTALVANQPLSLPAPVEALKHDGLWIGTTEFGGLAGISDSAGNKTLTRALNGLTWHGTALQVRVADKTAGRGGKALQVYVPSLPENLRVIWRKRNPHALGVPVAITQQRPAPTIIDLSIGSRIAEMKSKLAIVAPALTQPKGSAARASILRDIAARSHQGMHGKPVQVAVDTLRDWARLIETGNEEHLARQRRADAGTARYHVNAKWDKACPLPDAEKRPIAAALESHIRGQHRNLVSERKIDALASAKLQELGKDAGWLDAPLIRPGLHLVRKFASSRLVGINEKDAKLFHDKYRPSIHRRRPDAPMECVFGDVHPSDILILREDGSEATARMIAWFDWATHDVFYTLVLVPKDKAITQADIIASFVAMVQAWGLPLNLYLDNGSEYMNKAFIAGLEMLQGLCGRFHVQAVSAAELGAGIGDDNPSEDSESVAVPRTGTIRARPYNARAKVIEAFFAWLNKFMALIPGYIGGERMRKKTHNVGKRPAPYPGSFEQLRDGAFTEAVAFYRNEPQGGTMGGKSPNEIKREAIAAGWTPPASVAPEELLAAFAEPCPALVKHGGVKINGEWYWNDALVPVIGEKIQVRHASWKQDVALWIKPDGTVVLLQRDTNVDPLDTAGAKEQSRREGLQKRNVARLRAISPPTDAVADMARYNAASSPPPVSPAGPKVMLSPGITAQAEAIRGSGDTAARSPEKLPHMAYRDSKTGVIVRPAQPAPEPEVERFDIYATPPPQRKKPDASADAPGFDVYAAYAKKPPLNAYEKETETP